jgi:hypothetical protein
MKKTTKMAQSVTSVNTYKLARLIKRALQNEVFGKDGYLGSQGIALEAVVKAFPERRDDIVRTLRNLREEGYVEEYASGFNGWTYARGQVMLPPTALVIELLEG